MEILPPLLNFCIRSFKTPRYITGMKELLELTPLKWVEPSQLHPGAISMVTEILAEQHQPYSPTMQILIWNCRGAANSIFKRHFRGLIQSTQTYLSNHHWNKDYWGQGLCHCCQPPLQWSILHGINWIQKRNLDALGSQPHLHGTPYIHRARNPRWGQTTPPNYFLDNFCYLC